MKTRMQPVGRIFSRFTRVVRDLGQQLNKDIRLETIGDEVELDKTIIESLSDPLTHLIRNSCDHGLETAEERIETGKAPVGQLTLKAYHEAGSVHISITDDGRGVNVDKVSQLAMKKELITEEELDKMDRQEKIMLITRPGFSTADKVSDLSGRGVGMDVVKSTIEKLGGQLSIQSQEGQGSTILLVLPLTLAIVPAMIIRQDEFRYAIPQTSVEELLCLYRDQGEKIEYANLQETYRLRDELLPIVRLNETFNCQQAFSAEDKAHTIDKYHHSDLTPPEKIMVVVLKVAGRRYGLVVDEILSSEEIVINALHKSLEHLPCITGATVMGDGMVALILDAEGLANYNRIHFSNCELPSQEQHSQQQEESLEVFRFEYQQHSFAVAVSEMQRIVRINANDFQEIGTDCFITIGEQSVHVLNPLDYLQVAKKQNSEELFLIVIRNDQQNFGLLADNLLEMYRVDNFTERHLESAISGHFLVENRLNLLINFKKIIQTSQMNSFQEEEKIMIEMEV